MMEILWKIGKYTFPALVSLVILTSPSTQQQFRCRTNPDLWASTFVSDPSNCHLFLQCDWNSTNEVQKVSIRSCMDATRSLNFFDNGRGTNFCTDSSNQCANQTACPPEGQPDIMIADPYDRECRRYRQCRSVDGPYASCRAPLVFNRNTGMCDFEDVAPCTRPWLPLRCPAGFYGFYPGNLCYQYIYCSNGEILLNLECNYGMYFDEVAGSCLYDTNSKCPR